MSVTPESEKRIAQCARSLAEHLMQWARERREDDKKSIAACQSELCRLYKMEKNGELR